MSDISLKHTEEALELFLDDVIKKARANLKKQNKDASGALSNSFKSSYNVGKNSIEAIITGEQYAAFVDKGVTGLGSSKFTGKKKTVFKSEAGYRFGSGNFRGKGKEWAKKIDKWMYSRGIAPRDEKTGRFIKRDTANYLIRRSIFQHGIKPTRFFTNAFEEEYSKLPKEIIEAYALDVETFMEFILKE